MDQTESWQNKMVALENGDSSVFAAVIDEVMVDPAMQPETKSIVVRCACSTLRAITERLAGRIEAACVLENLANSAYRKIPKQFHW